MSRAPEEGKEIGFIANFGSKISPFCKIFWLLEMKEELHNISVREALYMESLDFYKPVSD